MPKMTPWLYKQVIITKITYAATAWRDRINIALGRPEQEHIQRAASITFAGATRTTLIKLLGDIFGPATTWDDDGGCRIGASISHAKAKSNNPRNRA